MEKKKPIKMPKTKEELEEKDFDKIEDELDEDEEEKEDSDDEEIGW